MQGSEGRSAITRNRVAAGSVWETRMRMDEVKGGIKVFTGEETRCEDDEDILRVSPSLKRNQSDNVSTERRKRKSWRPPEMATSNSAIGESPIQLRKARSLSGNSIRMPNGNNCRGSDTVGGVKRVLLIGNGLQNGEVELKAAEIETEAEKAGFDDKEIDIPVEKSKNVEEEKKINQMHDIPLLPEIENNPSPVIYHPEIDPIPVKLPVEVEEEIFESGTTPQNQMQNMVDLVMWRDVSRSAFVFGLGTFILLSSSYTKDLNFSLISAISYLGLVYLAVIFLYKSIIRRGEDLEADEMQILGEEEAMWIMRLLLPYVNELLIKIKALFSGDPETTMKLAVLLFVMARCGSSITIWTLAKLVFFGIFTIPKVSSSYSTQMARYGKFWLERFSDGWESCTHKKAVAAAVFTLVWNLSSIVARIWAVFMLVVGVRFYQQRGIKRWTVEEETMVVVGEVQQDSKAGQVAGPVYRRQRGGPTMMEVGREVKLRKGWQ